jgi:hypothetical protein
MATKSNDIFVQINDEIIKLEGSDKEIYLAELDVRNEKVKFEQAEVEAKAVQKAALLERLGITQDEARLLLA